MAYEIKKICPRCHGKGEIERRLVSPPDYADDKLNDISEKIDDIFERLNG